MVNKKSLATFVRTVGNQVISGFKHFLNNVKIGGDLIIDPNSLGAPATNVLTVDGSGVVKTATAFSGISVDSVSKVKHEVKAGVAINKGQAVYVTGADGTNMIVGLASNATEATSSKTMGLLESTVAINGKTNVITEGLLAGLDTSMASAGDVVWLGTGGNLLYGLANKPYAPAHLVFIGIVTRSNSNNGEIFVKVQNGFELNEIHDVDLKTTVPVNGHILGFNGTLWVNKTIAGWLGYTPANAANESNWNAAYNDKINSAAVTGTTTKTLTLTQQDGGTITASWTDINTDAVTSVFGRTGAVVATSGDYTTAQVTESGNLYFTNARGIGSTLTGYASGAGVISSADTILSAIQKLNGNIGALVTGVSSVNGLSGAVTLTTTNIAEGTNLYYTEARVNANTNVAANTAARHNAVTIGTANGLSLSTQVLSLGLASASTNGALSSTDWTTFNSKQAALNGTGFVKITGTTISYDNSTYYLASNPNGYTSNVGTVTSITATAGTGISISGSPITTSGTLTITNTAPDQTVVLTSGTGISVTGTYPNFTITNSSPSSGGTVTSIATTAPITGGTITSTGTIGITQAGASTDGYLSSTDWNTFNNKQPALTNPITGTGTTNYLPKFTGTTTLGNSQIFDNGTNVGIGTATPTNKFQIGSISGYNGNAFAIGNGTDQFAIFQASSFTQFYTNGGFLFATGNTESVRITSTGNVGIGTTSPLSLLSLSKSGLVDLQFNASDQATDEKTWVWQAGSPVGTGVYRLRAVNDAYSNGINAIVFTRSGISLVDTTFTGGNVGIGTTSPSAKLHVVGNTYIQSGVLFVDTIAGYATNKVSLAASTNFFLPSGNIGIKALNTTASVSLGTSSYDNNPLAGLEYSQVTGGGRLDLKVQTWGTGSDYGLTTGLTLVTPGFDTNNVRVGIGTTSPDSKLVVSGSGQITAKIESSNNQANVFLQGTFGQFENLAGDLYITNNAASSSIIFRAGLATERMRISSTGAIKLNAYGSGLNTGTATQRLAVDASGNVIEIPIGSGPVDGNGTANYVTKWSDTDTITNSQIFDNGTNVGIGTSSPVSALSIYKASGNAYIEISGNGNTLGSTSMLYGQDGGNNGYVWNRANAPVYFGTNNSVKMFLNTNGYLGIGTTTPAQKLEVNDGDALIRNAFIGLIPAYGVNYASFSHNSRSGAGQYSLLSGNAGETYVNSVNGQPIYFRHNNIDTAVITSAGNVGIGTTSPSEKLSVVGGNISLGAGYKLQYSSTAYITPENNVSGAEIATGGVLTIKTGGTTERVRVDASGNVGIGTVNPGAKLDVVGSAGIRVNEDGIGTKVISIRSDFAGVDPAINVSTNNALLLQTNNTERMRITSTGNVGIGTTSPGNLLTIGGNTRIVTGTTQGLFAYDASTGGAFIWSLTRYTDSNANDLNVNTRNGFGIRVGVTSLTNSGHQFYINNSGNVGIGTTSPTGKLSVVGDGTEYSNIVLRHGSNQEHLIYASTNIQYNLIGSGAPTWIWGQQGGAERMRLNNTGLGIGTASPQAKLDVTDGDFIVRDDANVNRVVLTRFGGIELKGNGTSFRTVGTPNTDALSLATNNTSRIYITSAGNVGIGTTSPAFKLDINGASNSSPFRVLSTNTTSLRTFFEATSGNVEQHFLYTGNQDWVLGLDKADSNKFKLASADDGFASAKLTVTTSGNVGIGTTSPDARLQITQTGGTQLKIVSGDAYGSQDVVIDLVSAYDYRGRGILYRNSTDNNKWFSGVPYTGGGYSIGYSDTTPEYHANSKLFVSSGGNVGIGTTSPAFKLDINAGSNAGTFLQGSSDVRYHVFSTSNSDWVGYELRSSNVNSFAGGMFRNNASNNRISIWNKNLEAISILDTGNVGIGTTSPSQKLHVNGNIIIPQNNYLYFDNTAHYIRRGSSNVEISGFNGINLITSGSTRVIVTEAGNVGIGTTTPGSYKLYVAGGQFGTLLKGGDLGTGSDVVRMLKADNSVAMLVRGDGNVGIGTTSPSHKLQVVTNAVAGKQNMAAIDRTAGNLIRFTNPQYSTDASMGLLLRVFPDSDARQGAGIIASGGANNATTDLDLFVTTSPDGLGGTSYSAVKINGLNGNVGIGTTSPSAKLQVGGSTKITGGDWPTANAGLEFNYVGNTSYIGSYDRTNSVYKGLFLFADNMTFETGASIRMYITSGGNVGIGTTSPNSLLEISGASPVLTINRTSGTSSTINFNSSGNNFASIISNPSNGENRFSIGPSVAWGGFHTFYTDTSERMRITAAGNVGIGTTSPNGKLEIVANPTGNTVLLGRTGGTSSIKALSDNGGYLALDSTGGATILNHYVSDNVWLVTGGGNVGIGTTSPNEKLTVSGKGYFNPYYPIVLTGKGSPEYGTNITLASDTGSTQGAVRMWSRYDGTGYAATTFERATTSQAYSSDPQLLTYFESMRISGAGNVGIGTTSPSHKLQIVGNAAISNNNSLYLLDTAGNAGFQIRNTSGNVALIHQTNNSELRYRAGFSSNSNNAHVFAVGADTEIVRFTNGGNVGIGTTSPGAKLEVYDATNPKIYISGGGLSSKAFVSGYAGNFDIGTEGSNPVTFYTNAIERVRIMPTGSVGIGTTSPATILDVNGTISVAGYPVISNSGNYNRIHRPSGTVGIYLGNATDAGNYYDNSTHYFRSSGGGSTYAVIASTGNVLIGTTTDSGFKLDTIGTGRFSQTTAIPLTVQRTTANSNVGIRYQNNTTSWYSGLAADDSFSVSFNDANLSAGQFKVATTGAATFTSSITATSFNGTTNNILSVGGTERMRIDSSGNVGIGTTSPGARLDVSGIARATSLSAVNGLGLNVAGYAYLSQTISGVMTFLGHNVRASDSVANTAIVQNAGWISSLIKMYYNEGITFHTDSTVYAAGATYPLATTERMRIQVNGNVGIGTASPWSRFTVSGALSASTSQISIVNTEGGHSIIRAGISGVTNNGMSFVTANVDGSSQNVRMVVGATGNVGIGTTSTTSKLHVLLNGNTSGGPTGNVASFQNSSVGSNAYVTLFGAYNAEAGIVFTDESEQFKGKIGYNNNSEYMYFQTDGSEKVRITAAGNVGIGTTSPAASLHIGANGGVIFGATAGAVGTAQITTTSATSPVSTRFAFGTDGTGWQYRIAKNTAGTIIDLVTVADNGRVGIGTTSPSTLLHVEGRIYAGDIGIATTSPTQKLHVVGNARITGAIFDSLNSSGTAGQVLSSTGTGTEWVTGGGGGGSTIIVKDEGTTVGSSFTTLDFYGSNIQAGASGSTAVITALNNAGTGSVYSNDTTAQYAPTASFANVEINTVTVEATAPDTASTGQKLIATITFGVDNVSDVDGFNNFDFRLYNSSASSAIADTTHSWCSYMSKGEFEKRTVFTFHIPLYDGVGGSDTIIVQAKQSTAYTPEIYYCALTLMEGTN